MGSSIGYIATGCPTMLFLLTIRKNNTSGHAKIEFEQEQIRKSMLEILSGDKGFPITLISDDKAIEKQEELQSTMLVYYKNQIEHNPNNN